MDWRGSEFEALLARSPSETTPLLLELVARQAARRRGADVLRQYREDRFVEPCPLDLRLAHRLDAAALSAAEGFEAVLLSPVAPLGTCSTVAPSSQDRTLSTVRGTEVVSDPTNVLALEAAARLRGPDAGDVRLCTIHQVLRAQPLPPNPNFRRHFRLFAMTEAGRARPDDGFEVAAFVRHVSVFHRLFDECETLGFRFASRRAVAFVGASARTLGRRVLDALGRALPAVRIDEETLTNPYYDGLRVLFGADSAHGDFIPIGDVGRFDWVARLTQNRKLRLVASGLGLQLIPAVFTAPDPAG